MNFLAHFYLSGNSEELLVGNFLGDFIKGKSYQNDFSPTISKGIKLHRFIDGFTDSHAIVRQGTQRLQPYFSKYSTVIIDIFYDYCLASQWQRYSEEPLDSFIAHSHKILQKHKHLYPPKAQKALNSMIKHEWLYHYSDLEGMANVLKNMEQRSRFNSKLADSIQHLIQDENIYKEEFNIFFPEVIKQANLQIQPD